MPYLFAFLWALPSGIVWLFNAEAFVVLQVTQTDAVPWGVAVCTWIGQLIGYAVLYLFATRILGRFASVRRAVGKVPVNEPGWKSYSMFATGGLIGIPPLMPMFAIYGTKRIGRLERYMAAAAPGRLLWYLGWAYMPEFFRGAFGWMQGG